MAYPLFDDTDLVQRRLRYWLVPDGIKTLSEPMLTEHQWGQATFIWGHTHKWYLSHQSLKLPWIIFSYIFFIPISDILFNGFTNLYFNYGEIILITTYLCHSKYKKHQFTNRIHCVRQPLSVHEDIFIEPKNKSPVNSTGKLLGFDYDILHGWFYLKYIWFCCD